MSETKALLAQVQFWSLEFGELENCLGFSA
jgi:hypothetical protein